MSEPWYRDGLRFGCTRCGHCCTGEPGTVKVTAEESTAIAGRLGLELPDYHRRFTRPLGSGVRSLRERSNGDCVFWDQGEGCTIYEVRPRQCRTWPFWRKVVESPSAWQQEAASCPGMNQGPRHDLEAILRSVKDDGTD